PCAQLSAHIDARGARAAAAPPRRLRRRWRRLLARPRERSVLDFARVERALDELDDLFLGRRPVGLLRSRLLVWALRAGHPELAAGHLVERLDEEAGVLRLLGLLPVERRLRRELERERVSVELRRPCLGEHRAGWNRPLLDGRQHTPAPRLLQLLELQARRSS